MSSLEGSTQVKVSVLLQNVSEGEKSGILPGDTSVSDGLCHSSILFSLGKYGPFWDLGVLSYQSVGTISIHQRFEVYPVLLEITWSLCRFACP